MATLRQWTCGVCTFNNGELDPECLMCGLVRPKTTPPALHASQSFVSSPSSVNRTAHFNSLPSAISTPPPPPIPPSSPYPGVQTNTAQRSAVHSVINRTLPGTRSPSSPSAALQSVLPPGTLIASRSSALAPFLPRAPTLTAPTCQLVASSFNNAANGDTILDDSGLCRTCQRTPAQHAESEYHCKKCTFLNPIDQDVCVMCSTSQRASMGVVSATEVLVIPRPPPRSISNAMLTQFEAQGKNRATIQQLFEKSRLLAKKKKEVLESKAEAQKKWIEADLFGMWTCPKCSHRCLPRTDKCEICHTSRQAAQDGGEEATLQRFTHLLSHIFEPRSDWCGIVVHRLMNDFELVVGGKVFRLLQVDAFFSPVLGHPGEWYFRHETGTNGHVTFHEGANKGLGIVFNQSGGGMSGYIIFSAIQENEGCKCGRKDSGCSICNLISEGPSTVLDRLLTWTRSVATLMEKLLSDGDLLSVTPNAFLYLRPLSTPLARTLDSSTFTLQGKEGYRYCSLSQELNKARTRRTTIATLLQEGFSLAETAQKSGSSLAEVNILAAKSADASRQSQNESLQITLPALKREPSLNASSEINRAEPTSSSSEVKLASEDSKSSGSRSVAEPSEIKSASHKFRTLGADAFDQKPALSKGKSATELGSRRSIGAKDLSKLLVESSIHAQASMLNTFFTTMYAAKPGTWSDDIVNNLVYPLSKANSPIPQAIFFGERDASIQDLVPKEPRKQLWLPLIMPLFMQDGGKSVDENAVLCEECGAGAAAIECEFCGVFCQECAEEVHARGRRREHPLLNFEQPVLASPGNIKLSASSQAQYLAGSLAQWAFVNQSTEDFASMMQDMQVSIESIGWNEVNCSKFKGCLVVLLKKLSVEIRTLKNKFNTEWLPKWDNLLFLLNMIEEFVFYSPAFKFGNKPPSSVLGLHLNELGCVDKELLLLMEDTLDKQLNVTSDTFLLSVEAEVIEEFRKRQKTMLSLLGLAKAGLAWCSTLEVEVTAVTGTILSGTYCKAAATLATTLMQRPRFKKGCDRRQASAVLMGAVSQCHLLKNKTEHRTSKESMSWDKVSIDAGLQQLKGARSSLDGLSTFFPKLIEVQRSSASHFERLPSLEEKRTDKMASLDEAVQAAKGLSNAMAARLRTFASEISSEVLVPLASLQRDFEREMATFPPRVQQMKVDAEAQKQRLRTLREQALKTYSDLVRAYWSSMDKASDDSAQRLLAAKNTCLNSFIDFERCNSEYEMSQPSFQDSRKILADMRGLEARRLALVRAYLRRFQKAFERFGAAYPACAELEKLLGGVEVEGDLRQFALEQPADSTDDIMLPFPSFQILNNTWVETLPEHEVIKANVDREEGTKEGQLFKLGARVKNWKQRLVVLKDHKLCYFEGKALRGDLEVAGGTISLIKEDTSIGGRKGNMFGFKPHGQNRVFTFQAPDFVERQKWIEALTRQGAMLGDSSELEMRASGMTSSASSASFTDDGDGRFTDTMKFAALNLKPCARIGFPEGWACKFVTVPVAPDETAATLASRMASKHRMPSSVDMEYVLVLGDEVLKDNTLVASRLDGLTALTIRQKPPPPWPGAVEHS